MRSSRMLTALAVLAALAEFAPAQTVLYPASVVQAEAEVRCGPGSSPDLYATNRLRRGELVQVVKELDGGWLAIVPPAGSFSWISTRFLRSENKLTYRVLTTDDAPVPVRYGSSLRNEKPTVEGVRLQRGAIVAKIGQALAADDGMWMPIEPPPGEVRYLRAEAVARQTAPPPTLAASSPLGSAPPPTVIPTAGTGAPVNVPPPSSPNHLLWQQAHQAAQAGQTTEAIRLYEQLGKQAANTDNELAMNAFSQAEYLRKQGRATPAPVRTPEGSFPIPSAGERLQPIPAALHAAAAPMKCIPCISTSASTSAFQPPHRTGAGRLIRSQRTIDGQHTYLLLKAQGQSPIYITGNANLQLEAWIGKEVELFGTFTYRQELRVYHLHAAQLTQVR